MFTPQDDAGQARDQVSNTILENPLGSRAEKIKTIISSFIDAMGHVQGEKPVTFDTRLEKNIILDLNSRGIQVDQEIAVMIRSSLYAQVMSCPVRRLFTYITQCTFRRHDFALQQLIAMYTL
jgi:hypothetical protein